VMTGPSIISNGINQGPAASSLSIQNCMDQVLGCPHCVTVTGALVTSGYTGDNNVVSGVNYFFR
jgi:hypothetical protein